MKKCIIGLDIGGTAIKGALFADTGALTVRDEIASRHGSGAPGFMDSVCEFVMTLSRRRPVGAVGLGIAGVLDPDRATLIESPNMPELPGYPLKAELEKRLRCPVIIENDANAAALGELKAGTGRGHENFIFFTLGTGIGSGLILNSRLWRGEQGRAGEFGHVTVYPGGEPCGCGKRGCLEAHSSGTAIVRMAAAAARQSGGTVLRAYADTPGDLTPELIYRHARAGDEICLDIFKSMARGLATAIAGVHTLLDICTFIVGGGVSGAYDLFCPMVLKEVDQRVFCSSRGRVRLLKAHLGNDAGVYGASYAARQAFTPEPNGRIV